MGLSGILPRPRKRTSTSKGATLGQVIAFANQKGGVAKTTTTLNLAVAFKEHGFEVLTVDLDPQGQPDHVSGHGPRSGRAVDVRRPRPLDAGRGSHPSRGGRCRRLVDRPCRRGNGAFEHDRARARAAESAAPGAQPLRLHPHRHAAVPRPPDDQRAHGVGRRDRPRPVRVPLAPRSRPAREHAQHDPGEPEPRRRDQGHPPDDVRLAHACTAARPWRC